MPTSPHASDRPTLFCLHFLGGSAREWAGIATALAPAVRCVPIDLPGFGNAAQRPGYTVAEMADAVAARIGAEAPARWLIAGHSMGAKVATVVARRAEDGAAGLTGLTGLVLLEGSPPGPEPMDDSQRQRMLGWFGGDRRANRADARRYIAENAGAPLPPDHQALAVEDVLRTKRTAWVAWLTAGSREDWSHRVGMLNTPALLVTGDGPGELGATAQTRLMAPHFAQSRLVVLPGAGHLLPWERPAEIARLIIEEIDAASVSPQGEPLLDPAYVALLKSDRVSARTRATLLDRMRPAEATALDAAEMATLRAVTTRVVPQRGAPIDLAARIARELGQGEGDGWRFADLPADREAFRAALATLEAGAKANHGMGFAALDGTAQDAMLAAAARGDPAIATTDAGLSATQMTRWFEDLRAAAVRSYVSHPATLSRLGYSGVANGGDGVRKQGFVETGVGQREAWEPLPHMEPAT